MHIYNSNLFSHLKNVTARNLKFSKQQICNKSVYFFNFFAKHYLIKGYYKINKNKLVFLPNYKMFEFIKKINLFSKPSNRKYSKIKNLNLLIKKNHQFGLISTSIEGIILFNRALQLKIGGEIVFFLKTKYD